ncbi:MAG: 2-phosphosulfolactate phosphatase [Paludibacteraceae bacterium]|nr:2-phosphosulfolactate phosphatase [Paludibacteraceae bacterium]
MKKIDVIITAGTVQASQAEGNIAVVIDVLRASSVICTALQNEAKAVIPVETLEEAFEFRTENCLLAGERKGFKPEGFNLGNSPFEYKPEIIAGKDIILSTTNGTQAIKNSRDATEIIVASFLNIDTVCNYLLSQPLDVCIVCAGTENRFSLDDALCAGNIISILCAKSNSVSLTDSAFSHKTLYESMGSNLQQALQDGCFHYGYLKNNGFASDVDFCLQKNIFNILPKLSNNRIISC